ncbi:hypothetical protein K439DRAFT_1631066 [Ramaria rubella]|nr:hypothetical protein K439DRAFT_1631066 [Ramaria rubella]
MLNSHHRNLGDANEHVCYGISKGETLELEIVISDWAGKGLRCGRFDGLPTDNKVLSRRKQEGMSGNTEGYPDRQGCMDSNGRDFVCKGVFTLRGGEPS